MGKYGKKHVIDLNPLNYSICLAGIGGIGKTTLAKEVCEKLVGEEGYIHLNIGREAGVDAINNIITEDVPDFETLTEIVDDIVENKTSDYPELKVVIMDSLDELVRITETEIVRKEKIKDNNIDSILKVKGGFGKGQDYCMDVILDKIFELKSVGVQTFLIAHTKKSDMVDAVTQTSFSQLTADISQRQFNAIKNKMDIVAVGYLDRQFKTEKTGRKNVVTKQEITVNRVAEETRVISFRDDSYCIDSKCRFAEIVDKIPFDSDEFIKALKDAIEAENTKGGITEKEAKKIQADKDKKLAEEATENSRKAKEFATEVDADKNVELIQAIKPLFLSDETSQEVKDKVKTYMKENGVSFKAPESTSTKHLEEIFKMLS